MLDEIIRIGREGSISDNDVETLLPNFPVLHGSESVFSIEGDIVARQNDETIDHIIKGLHYIELEYRRRTNCDFGFGSPSQTYPLLERYVDKNASAAKALWNWIRENGGNYYIPRCKLLTKEETAEKRRQYRSEIERGRSARKQARSAQVRLKHRAHEARIHRDRRQRDRLEQMDATSLLSQLMPRPIYFYATALESIAVVSQDEYELLLEVINVHEKMKPTRGRNKLLKRLRELATGFESSSR